MSESSTKEARQAARANGADPKPPERARTIDDYIDELSGKDNRADELAMEIAGYLVMAGKLKQEMRRADRKPEERALLYGPDDKGDVTEEEDTWDSDAGKVVRKKQKFRSYNEAFKRLVASIEEAKAEAREIKKLEKVEEKIPACEKTILDNEKAAIAAEAAGRRNQP